MASKRRYKIDAATRDYHATFDAARLSSNILNAAGQSVSAYSKNLSDKHQLESLLYELIGFKEQRFYDNSEGVWKLAALPSLAQELEEIQLKFEDIKVSRIQEGRAEPTQLPSDLREKKYQLEAVYDVRREESEVLQDWISKIDDSQEKERQRRLLRDGIRCCGRLRGGILTEIDGQRVSLLEHEGEEVLYIDDPLSPYNGLSIRDYNELHKQVVQWRKDFKKKYKQDVKEGKKRKPLSHNLRGPRPPFPKGAVNYAEIAKEQQKQREHELEKQITRTK